MNRFLTPEELREQGFQAVGENVRIDRTAVIINPSSISLGNDCRIDAFALVSAGLAGVRVGSHVHLGAGSQIFGGGGLVLLEDFTCLSGRVSCYTVCDDFTGGFLTNPTVPDAYRNVRTGAIILRKHSLVGCGSVILPGVEMGFGSAAGALTLLRHSVPAGVVVAGNPARALDVRRELSLLRRLERDLLGDDEGMEKRRAKTASGVAGDSAVKD